MTTSTDQIGAAELTEELLLDSLLSELHDDDIIEGLDVPEPAHVVASSATAAQPDDALLADVIAEAEMKSAKNALYADQKAPEVSEGDIPQETVSSKPKKAKKSKKATNSDDETPKAAKEPKAPMATLVNTKPGDLLKIRLGERLADYLTFNVTDTDEQSEDKRAFFIDKLNDRDAIANKVMEKVLQFFGWMVKSDAPNEVIRRALVVLKRDGELTSGDKGNLQLELLAKPYSLGTARSQANQIFMLFPLLEITMKEKGRMVANPDSALMIAANAMLGL
ncbi:MAG: hypothetical protein NVS3B3_04420 [Aquirhabdus sp.]